MKYSQEVLDKVCGLYEQLQSPTKVARQLNSEQISTLKEGSKWTESTVRGLLTRAGVFKKRKAKKQVVEECYEQIQESIDKKHNEPADPKELIYAPYNWPVYQDERIEKSIEAQLEIYGFAEVTLIGTTLDYRVNEETGENEYSNTHVGYLIFHSHKEWEEYKNNEQRRKEELVEAKKWSTRYEPSVELDQHIKETVNRLNFSLSQCLSFSKLNYFIDLIGNNDECKPSTTKRKIRTATNALFRSYRNLKAQYIEMHKKYWDMQDILASYDRDPEGQLNNLRNELMAKIKQASSNGAKELKNELIKRDQEINKLRADNVRLMKKIKQLS